MTKPKIKIGVSSRRHGSMRKNKKIDEKNLKGFLEEYGIDRNAFVMMDQIHGNHVAQIREHRKVVKNTDGIVTNKKNIFLGVYSADCVPLVLSDQDHEVVSAIHAGYKGILNGVVENAVDAMIESGAYATHIDAIVGPAIGNCCYDIDMSRADLFRSKFENPHIEIRKTKNYINLPELVKSILIEKGLKNSKIFISHICTSCDNSEYFSYRRDGKEDSGMFVSFVGME